MFINYEQASTNLPIFNVVNPYPYTSQQLSAIHLKVSLEHFVSDPVSITFILFFSQLIDYS